MAWSYASNSRPVSHAPGKEKMILGWQVPTTAHDVCQAQQGKHSGVAMAASRPASHSHEPHGQPSLVEGADTVYTRGPTALSSLPPLLFHPTTT